MNISYSFTIPESIAVISLAALIMFMAVWILIFLTHGDKEENIHSLKNK